uniref:ABC transmembrane type-1 domain-containing protein n=1 Tax=Timema poppense TaxID=170557 RepID=A0A7R9GU91_TIMPO|nr:unnamed protein product [Timema poppensis]
MNDTARDPLKNLNLARQLPSKHNGHSEKTSLGRLDAFYTLGSPWTVIRDINTTDNDGTDPPSPYANDLDMPLCQTADSVSVRKSDSKKREMIESQEITLGSGLLMWTVDLFKKGFKQDLSQDDLFEPLSKDKSQHLGDKLEKNWQHELKASEKTGHSPNLLKVIFMTYKREIIQLGVFQFFIELLVRMTQPYFLGQLLTYFQPGSETTKETAYLYAGALAACVFLNVFTQHFILQAFHLGMRIRVAFCSLLYRKILSLRLSRAALGETATGKVVNLLSNDVARFDLVFLMFHSLWLGPLVTVAIAYIIWQEAGVPGLVGVIVVLLVLPTQAYLARLTAKYRLQTAYKTDERVRLMDEIITGVRVIKMYAWERPFASMIRWARKMRACSRPSDVLSPTLVYVDPDNWAPPNGRTNRSLANWALGGHLGSRYYVFTLVHGCLGTQYYQHPFGRTQLAVPSWRRPVVFDRQQWR